MSAWPTPTKSGHGAAAGTPNSGRLAPFPHPDLISAVQSQSDGPNKEIPLQPRLLQKSPLVFKVPTRSPKCTSENTFSDFEDVNSVLRFKIRFQEITSLPLVYIVHKNFVLTLI